MKINLILQTIRPIKAFKAVENNARETPNEEFKKYHGFNGLLHVQDDPDVAYDILKDAYQAAKNLGVPSNDGVRQNGVGYYQVKG